MALISQVNSFLNGIVWGPFMLALLIGIGIYLSVRTGFLQLRHFGRISSQTFGSLLGKKHKSRDGQSVTPFEAVCTAMAGTVGVGNVAGVAGAIFIGGPGAVFWMWISALFGMCTKYAEIVLAVHFRQAQPNGAYLGGPMYYIEKGLHCKWLACVFALLGVIACFGIGNATQAAEISIAVNSLTGASFDSSVLTGIVLALVVGVVIFGGLHRISQVTSRLVPFMALLYIAAGLALIFSNLKNVPAAFAAIVQSAFSTKAAGSGILGYACFTAMRNGFARGVFSNEAGLGTAPMAHAAANTKSPVEQGFWGVMEVFIDTIIICTITGLAVVLSGQYTGTLSGGALTAAAFDALLPLGGTIVRVSILLFALSTILGWEYYGETCLSYLSSGSAVARRVFQFVFVAVAMLGAISSSTNVLKDTKVLDLIWSISDTMNGMMALPNLIALALLSGTVIQLTKGYFAKK